MKKAIIIMAHQKPEQINIFLKQLLFDKETYIFIHVNKLCESIIPSILRHERVIISKNNIAVHWGDDDFLQAELIMMREVMNYPIQFEYIFINSGQDLLVRTGLDDYLVENKGKVFVDRLKISAKRADAIQRGRLLHYWPKLFRRLYNFKYHPFRMMRSAYYRIVCHRGTSLFKKRINYDFDKVTFYFEYFWCTLPRDVVDYILDFTEKEREFMKIYKSALIPEEGFISTVIMMNPRFHEAMQYNNGAPLSLMYKKRFVNNHPPLLGKQDIEEIENSGAFFARKFDIDYDREVIEYFYNKITGKSGDENQ